MGRYGARSPIHPHSRNVSVPIVAFKKRSNSEIYDLENPKKVERKIVLKSSKNDIKASKPSKHPCAFAAATN
jgi:hypothetical protein